MAKQQSQNPPEEIINLFNQFDKNGDGKISCSELIDNLGELGTHVSPDEVRSMIQGLDKDADGRLNLNEFADFVVGGGDGNEQKELRDAFDLYDMDKNGVIFAGELHAVMKMLGMKCTLGDCKKMISQVDKDGDGNVTFEEFKKMMSDGLAN